MPYRQCPSFDTCNCNDCPLDPASALRGGHRVALPGEPTCSATRATRELIALATGIDPRLVLLPRERRSEDARRRWAELPPDLRDRILAAGAGTRFSTPEASGWPVSATSSRAVGLSTRPHVVASSHRAL